MALFSSKTSPVTVNVPIVTGWQSYTPTVVGLGTIASVVAWWRRVGSEVEVTFRFTSGTHTATTVSISLPTGLEIDATAIGNNTVVGDAGMEKTPFSGRVVCYTSMLPNNLGIVADGVNVATGSLGTAWANTTVFSGNFSIPISGWTTHGPVSNVAYALTQGGNSLGMPVTVGAVDGQVTTLGGSGGSIVMGRFTEPTAGQVGESQIKIIGETTADTGANVYKNVGNATITLTGGVYLLSYNAYCSALTGGGSLEIYNSTSGVQIPGSVAYVTTGSSNATRVVPVVVPAGSTFTFVVRLRGTANNDFIVRGQSLTVNLTNSDNDSTFMSVRIA